MFRQAPGLSCVRDRLSGLCSFPSSDSAVKHSLLGPWEAVSRASCVRTAPTGAVPGPRSPQKGHPVPASNWLRPSPAQRQAPPGPNALPDSPPRASVDSSYPRKPYDTFCKVRPAEDAGHRPRDVREICQRYLPLGNAHLETSASATACASAAGRFSSRAPTRECRVLMLTGDCDASRPVIVSNSLRAAAGGMRATSRIWFRFHGEGTDPAKSARRHLRNILYLNPGGRELRHNARSCCPVRPRPTRPDISARMRPRARHVDKAAWRGLRTSPGACTTGA